MMYETSVRLTPQEAVEKINEAIVEGSITGELIDSYTANGKDGSEFTVLIYEKHYYRAGNRLTCTVIVDNLQGKTNVHWAAAGGGSGLFRFDWGAAEQFEEVVREALQNYIN